MVHVVGVGRALVDYYLFDESLESVLGKSNRNFEINPNALTQIKSTTSPVFRLPGGSTFNTIFHYLKLNGKGIFVGTIGMDENGNYFIKKINTYQKSNDYVKSFYLKRRRGSTGFTINTPNSSFFYYGVSGCIDRYLLSWVINSVGEEDKILLTETYLFVLNPSIYQWFFSYRY